MTLRDILTPVFFFKTRTLIAFIVPLVAALAAASTAPHVYVADTRLLILPGDDYVPRNTLSEAVPGLVFDRSQIVKAETEIIGSRGLAADTLQAVGVTRLFPKTKGPEAFNKAVDAFEKDLTVENIPQSNVLSVTLKGRDPIAVSDTLNKLVELYLVRRRKIFEQDNLGSVDKETASLSGQLADVEKQLSDFTARTGIADLPLELTAISNQEVAINTQLADLDRQLADREGREAQLKEQRTANPQRQEVSTDYARSLEVDSLEQSLVGLQNQRRDAGQEYVDGNPVLKDLDERIAAVKAQLAKAPTQQVNATRQGVNPIRQDIEQRVSNSQADEAGLRRARTVAQTQLNTIARKEAELIGLSPQYRDLIRKRDLLEAASTDLAKRSQEAKLANYLSRSQANVRVLQAAHPPTMGKTGRPVILAAGLVVGLIAAGGMVIISVALFQGMLTPNAAMQKLATPVIMTINNEPGLEDAPHLGGPATPVFMRADNAKVLSHVLHRLSQGRSAIQMIGTEDGVGVTSLMADFALLAARERQRVLLLDFEPTEGRSVMDKLRQRGAELQPVDGLPLVRRVVGASLFVMQTLPDSAAMNEREWAKVLDQIGEGFDLLLVDAPPLSRSLLGLFAAPSVDATILVVEAEKTRAPVALNTIERVGAVGGEVLASVFNKRRFYIPRPLYERL